MYTAAVQNASPCVVINTRPRGRPQSPPTHTHTPTVIILHWAQHCFVLALLFRIRVLRLAAGCLLPRPSPDAPASQRVNTMYTSSEREKATVQDERGAVLSVHG